MHKRQLPQQGRPRTLFQSPIRTRPRCTEQQFQQRDSAGKARIPLGTQPNLVRHWKMMIIWHQLLINNHSITLKSVFEIVLNVILWLLITVSYLTAINDIIFFSWCTPLFRVFSQMRHGLTIRRDLRLLQRTVRLPLGEIVGLEKLNLFTHFANLRF